MRDRKVYIQTSVGIQKFRHANNKGKDTQNNMPMQTTNGLFIIKPKCYFCMMRL